MHHGAKARFISGYAVAFLFALLVVPLVSAHEVYVLKADTISSDLAVQEINVATSLQSPGAQRMFIFSVLFGIVGFIAVSYLLHTKLSKHLDERFARIRPYAHLVIRIGLGVSFLWGAYHNSVFGPELALTSIVGGMAWKPVLIVIGALLILGAATRLAAFAAFLVFLTVTFSHPSYLGSLYMMNYLNYLGEIAVLVLERGTKFSVDEYIKWPSHLFHHKFPQWFAILLPQNNFHHHKYLHQPK